LPKLLKGGEDREEGHEVEVLSDEARRLQRRACQHLRAAFRIRVRVRASEFRVQGLGIMLWDLGFRFEGSGFGVHSFGFRI